MTLATLLAIMLAAPNLAITPAAPEPAITPAAVPAIMAATASARRGRSGTQKRYARASPAPSGRAARPARSTLPR